MRYEDNEYNYNYNDLAENIEDLGLDEEPWMDGHEDSEEDDDEVPSYGKNYYPSIEDEDE